ncbi:hypothetical protein [Micromonospora sp. NPDC005161]
MTVRETFVVGAKNTIERPHEATDSALNDGPRRLWPDAPPVC